MIGSVQELLESREETQILTSELSPDALKDVEQVLARHGANLKKVSHPTTTLEDLFLHTVSESEKRPGRRFEPGERPTTEKATS